MESINFYVRCVISMLLPTKFFEEGVVWEKDRTVTEAAYAHNNYKVEVQSLSKGVHSHTTGKSLQEQTFTHMHNIHIVEMFK